MLQWAFVVFASAGGSHLPRCVDGAVVRKRGSQRACPSALVCDRALGAQMRSSLELARVSSDPLLRSFSAFRSPCGSEVQERMIGAGLLVVVRDGFCFCVCAACVCVCVQTGFVCIATFVRLCRKKKTPGRTNYSIGPIPV